MAYFVKKDTDFDKASAVPNHSSFNEGPSFGFDAKNGTKLDENKSTSLCLAARVQPMKT